MDRVFQDGKMKRRPFLPSNGHSQQYIPSSRLPIIHGPSSSPWIKPGLHLSIPKICMRTSAAKSAGKQSLDHISHIMSRRSPSCLPNASSPISQRASQCGSPAGCAWILGARRNWSLPWQVVAIPRTSNKHDDLGDLRIATLAVVVVITSDRNTTENHNIELNGIEKIFWKSGNIRILPSHFPTLIWDTPAGAIGTTDFINYPHQWFSHSSITHPAPKMKQTAPETGPLRSRIRRLGSP